MKRILLFTFFILIAQLGFSQKLEIKEVNTYDRFFNGSIDGQYSITLYLKFSQFHPEHGGIYTVSGWYYYDNVKTKIPLQGIYYGALILFSFKDPEMGKKVLNFEASPQGHPFSTIDYFQELTEFDEKIELSLDREKAWINGTWKKGDKTLPMQLRSRDISVRKSREYLILPNKQWLNLTELSAPTAMNEVMASSADGKNILVNVSYPSSLHYMGRCGAGTEDGIMALSFNNNWELTDFESVVTGSCYMDILIQEEKTLDNGHTQITIEDYNNNKKTTLVLDKTNAVIVSKEVK